MEAKVERGQDPEQAEKQADTPCLPDLSRVAGRRTMSRSDVDRLARGDQ